VVSATTEPTDRSMPPEMMITVMPSAAAATIAVWRATSSRFAGRKNRAPIRREDDGDQEQARGSGHPRLSTAAVL
jgi:hypothetical protein